MKLKFGANLRHESGHHGTMRPTVRPKNERYRRTVFIRKNYNCRALYMGVFRLRMTLKLFILYLFWIYCCSQICHLFCCKILQGHIVSDGVRQQDVILKIFSSTLQWGFVLSPHAGSTPACVVREDKTVQGRAELGCMLGFRGLVCCGREFNRPCCY